MILFKIISGGKRVSVGGSLGGRLCFRRANTRFVPQFVSPSICPCQDQFIVKTERLYGSICPSVRLSVRPSVVYWIAAVESAVISVDFSEHLDPKQSSAIEIFWSCFAPFFPFIFPLFPRWCGLVQITRFGRVFSVYFGLVSLVFFWYFFRGVFCIYSLHLFQFIHSLFMAYS